MVSSFGANARVVEIVVDSSGAYYQVIRADHQLHIRDYAIVESEVEAGTEGYNRKTTNFARVPTAAASRRAVLREAHRERREAEAYQWRNRVAMRWREHGRNRARTFSTRRDAPDFDAEVRRQRRAGTLAALDAGTETLGE